MDDLDGPPLQQHLKNPIPGAGGRQVLERVATHDVAQLENRPVERLQDLRKNVKARDNR
jgi:hypothetical protein